MDMMLSLDSIPLSWGSHKISDVHAPGKHPWGSHGAPKAPLLDATTRFHVISDGPVNPSSNRQ